MGLKWGLKRKGQGLCDYAYHCLYLMFLIIKTVEIVKSNNKSKISIKSVKTTKRQCDLFISFICSQ